MSSDVADGPVRRCPPVVVGGVGGSGTRLIAQLLLARGYFLGSDLNTASDNLWFTLLFKWPDVLSLTDGEFGDRVEIFGRAMAGGGALSHAQRESIRLLAERGHDQHDAAWLRARAATLAAGHAARPTAERWGWKEPNTHLVLDRLARFFPGLKYIFVVRHGLDMALSSNQGQPRLWGPLLLQEPFEATPRYSLRYWCAAHRRVTSLSAALGDRFHWLNYDELCRDKQKGVASLCRFLGGDDVTVPEALLDHVTPPTTIGRYKLHRRDVFDEADVAYVESLGFVVDGR